MQLNIVEILFGIVLGTLFSAFSIVDIAMCMSGTDVALVYYRAFPLPIVSKIKNTMMFLLPLLLLEIVTKVRNFCKKQGLVTTVGLVKAAMMASILYVPMAMVVPSEEAAKEPIAAKGKDKALAEDNLVADLYTGALAMLVINGGLLLLTLVEFSVRPDPPAPPAPDVTKKAQ